MKGDTLDIVKKCKLCGDNITKDRTKFCSDKCSQKYHEQNRPKRNIFEHNCALCGKNIKNRNKSNSKNAYCSGKCREEYFRKLKTEAICRHCGNVFYREYRGSIYCSKDCKTIYAKEHETKHEYICHNCGIKFSRHDKQRGEHVFCSIACVGEWHAVVHTGDNAANFKYKNSEIGKLKNAMNMVEKIKQGKIKKEDSLPQIIIDDILKNENIKSEKEYNIKYYLVDNFLKDHNLFIEVMGDYWHCNPLRYTSIKYNMQLKNIIKDKRKLSYIKNNYKIPVLYLWESDIYNNFELCRSLILHYVYTGGVLKNFHSFNYHISENGITLNEEIIDSYADYKEDEMKKMCVFNTTPLVLNDECNLND